MLMMMLCVFHLRDLIFIAATINKIIVCCILLDGLFLCWIKDFLKIFPQVAFQFVYFYVCRSGLTTIVFLEAHSTTTIYDTGQNGCVCY